MKRIFVAFCLIGLLYLCLSTWQQGQPGNRASISTAAISNLIATMQPGHQVQSSSSTSVEGTPTLSAAFIDSVLAAFHSRAAGTGQALYQDALQYGIDDAYALAFFMHESLFGTSGVATVTHSLGNIKCSVGYQCFEGFRLYQSWQAGFEDWYKLIKNLYIGQWHLTTIEQIIPVYAPASDHNNVAGYIAAIENAVRTWRSEVQS